MHVVEQNLFILATKKYFFCQ